MTEALSVPGLFLTCVQYFELVQLGRNFENDFHSITLVLRGTQIRLQRWGDAAGITEETSPAYAAPLKDLPQEQLHYVEDALKFIHKSLKRHESDAKEYAETLQARAKSAGAITELETIDEDVQVTTNDPKESLAKRANVRIKRVARRALTSTKELPTKTKWALYKKEEFTSLLRDVSEQVSILEKCFPVAVKGLARADAAQLVTGAPAEEIETITGAAVATDPELSGALKTESEKKGHTVELATFMDKTVGHLGNKFLGAFEGNVASHIFKEVVAKNEARVHIGDTYGVSQSTQAQEAESLAGEAREIVLARR